ncbi:hypothetical protein DH2020_027877 [Rehmannia glutinosa]|uniref:RRM domain-containing protein n=1 Tax=Rehmannia glutinosa TaxID=99300 RepID=A0ABR0VT03_REHGL
MDQGPPYYGTSSPSYMYDAPPPPPPAYSYIPPPFPVVRLRGLPFDCAEAEIVDFFHGLDVIDVLFVHKGGKFTGEAYCVLGYPLQVDFALQRNRQNIGRRYVEVFRSRKDEYYKAIAHEAFDAPSGSPRRGASRARSSDEWDLSEFKGVLRLRGLPFSASKEGIINFFKDFELSEDKVHLIANSEGRPAGEAFVEFGSPEESKAAMSRDRMTLGNRYIELFPASREELEEAASRGRYLSLKVSWILKIVDMLLGLHYELSQSLTGMKEKRFAKSTYSIVILRFEHAIVGTIYSYLLMLMPKSFEGKEATEPTPVLRMRGLPFSAGKDDIIDFFKNFTLSQESIHITYNFEGRPTGEAFVEFASTEDAKAALVKDRMTLGSRYIELFQSSPEELNEASSRGRWHRNKLEAKAVEIVIPRMMPTPEASFVNS